MCFQLYMFAYRNQKNISQRTTNNTCVTSKDSDQPVHPPSMTRVLVYPTLNSQEVEGTYNQQRLWSDCAEVLKVLSCTSSMSRHASYQEMSYTILYTYHMVCVCTQILACPTGFSVSVSVSLPSVGLLYCLIAWYTVQLYGNTCSPIRNSSLCRAVPWLMNTAAWNSEIHVFSSSAETFWTMCQCTTKPTLLYKKQCRTLLTVVH